MTVAEDAATLRKLADYHRQAGDWEGNSPTAALEHENWAETLEEVANLLDRLAALVDDSPGVMLNGIRHTSE